MAKIDHKEQLFENFFHAAKGTLEALEQQFAIEGVLDQVFGKDASEEEAKAKLQASLPWATLWFLYDYAFDGIDHGQHPTDIVIGGADVIQLVTSENYRPSEEWDQIIAMADGRFALDDGSSLEVRKLALLANVDIRTVRNAISAGALICPDKETGYVENSSARRWLHDRRGFKPTATTDRYDRLTLAVVDTPLGFGAFLVNQRKRIGLENADDKLVASHPSATPHAISQLEAGIFALPLDAVFPISDFYQVDRKEFLECVMRVFFYEERQMLIGESATAVIQK